ncbi:MAG: hypothetical protein F6K09_22310 [Merismopedia sp. SIO2A8]|nr:hypothetical protein [Merismopedia sp. SIO2A8]
MDATMDPLFDSAFQDAPTETMDFSERPDFQADLNSFDDDLGDDLEDDSSLIADETAELVHDLTSSDLTSGDSASSRLTPAGPAAGQPEVARLTPSQETPPHEPVLAKQSISAKSPPPVSGRQGTPTHGINPSTTERSPSALVPISQGRSPSPGMLQSVGPAKRSIDPSHRTRRPQRPRWLYPLTGAAAVMIAVVGYHAYNEIAQSPEIRTSVPTEKLVSNASIKLDAGELDAAQGYLDQVPKTDLDKPTVNFLQGRLIWELLKNNNTDFSFEDTSRYWEWAVHSSQTPEYYNALGFSLYAEGRLNDAIEAWGEALMALHKQGIEVVPISSSNHSELDDHGSRLEHSIAVPTGTIADSDALTAYAGMALALAQLAGDSATWSQSVDLMTKVAQIQQVVLASAPEKFEPEALQSNWLWTESAIKEWDLLSQIKIQ